MKRIVSLVLTLVVLLFAATAIAQEYAEPTLYNASDVLGLDTIYRLYDHSYYEETSDQPGTVVGMKFTSEVYEKSYKRSINVYLPYGYDENGTERYPVIYFFHGRGCDQDTLLFNPQTKNAFDNMIATGIVEPFILVTPTYYYDVRHNLYDIDLFAKELRTEIMPLVEGTYRTYAETADDEGFRASRTMRAISGFSMGSMTTMSLFDKMVDYSYYFLPFSGAGDWSNVLGVIDGEGPFANDFFIYMACGGEEDGAYEGCVDLVKTMAADTAHFSYGKDMAENNFYFCLSDNIHQDLTSRYYLYNAFVDGLFK